MAATTPGNRLVVIACGALAHEITALRRLNGWDTMDVRCLPPELHNHPERIPPAVRELIDGLRADPATSNARLFVAYADCGTGGTLDTVLQEYGVERLPGAHCYEFYASPRVFAQLADAEPGTFYLTDFLLRHFDRLVMQGLGLDRHPELLPVYFGNYRRVLYLSQARTPDADTIAQGEAAARKLGLEFHWQHTGYGQLGSVLASFAAA